MTPKEKAKKLVGEYLHFVWQGRVELGKQCALIAVEEIINSNPTIINGVSDFRINVYYWEAVKQEIEKL